MKFYSSLKVRTKAAFTLIELLLVLGIITLVIALAIPALGHATAAAQLTQVGDLVMTHLSDAQQRAVATDSEIEIRFYEATATNAVDPEPRIRALQLFTLQPETAENPTGTEANYQPVSELINFDTGLVISKKTKLTSLVDLGFKTPSASEEEPEQDEVSGRYLAIRFRPDGSTNLPPTPGVPWFITVVNANTETVVEGEGVVIPPNFFTIQVDAVTGRLRSFRP